MFLIILMYLFCRHYRSWVIYRGEWKEWIRIEWIEKKRVEEYTEDWKKLRDKGVNIWRRYGSMSMNGKDELSPSVGRFCSRRR